MIFLDEGISAVMQSCFKRHRLSIWLRNVIKYLKYLHNHQHIVWLKLVV